jgi:hypothetical protein
MSTGQPDGTNTAEDEVAGGGTSPPHYCPTNCHVTRSADGTNMAEDGVMREPGEVHYHPTTALLTAISPGQPDRKNMAEEGEGNKEGVVRAEAQCGCVTVQMR